MAEIKRVDGARTFSARRGARIRSKPGHVDAHANDHSGFSMMAYVV
jgi:hypothetical protein